MNQKQQPKEEEDDNVEGLASSSSNQESEEESEIGSPPSIDASTESASATVTRNNGNGNSNGSGNGNLKRGGDNDDGMGKIRAVSSRDTDSTATGTTYMSHSTGGNYSHTSSTGMSFGTSTTSGGGGGTMMMSHASAPSAFGQHHPNPRSNHINTKANALIPHQRRQRRRRPNKHQQLKKPSNNLYQHQIKILLSATGTSLLLFLFFFLHIFAFTALCAFTVSISMLLYTSYTYLTYLIQIGDLNILSLLPQSMRDQLLHRSIHEILTDSSDSMMDRYSFLLLYFIPGLSPEQIQRMVNRLPPEQRELVMNPGGMARMVLPQNVSDRVVARRNNFNDAGSYGNRGYNSHIQMDSHDQQYLPLPIIEEDELEEAEQEVTTGDAIRGIFHTARTLVTGTSNDEDDDMIGYEDEYNDDYDNDYAVGEEVYVTTTSTPTASNIQSLNDLSWENIDSNEETTPLEVSSHDDNDEDENIVVNDAIDSDSDDISYDLGLEVSPDALSGNMQEGQLTRLARRLGLRSSREDEQEQSQEQEQHTRRLPPATVTAPSNTDSHAHTNTHVHNAHTPPIHNLPPPPHLMDDDDYEHHMMTLRQQRRLLAINNENNTADGGSGSGSGGGSGSSSGSGDIITDAVNTVIQNYYNDAIRTITITAANAIDNITPSIIRAGVRLSSMSGLGLLSIFSSTLLSRQSFTINVMGRSITSRNLADGRNGRNAIRGLSSTFFFGMVTVASAYLTRGIARRRRDLLNNENGKDKEGKGKSSNQ